MGAIRERTSNTSAARTPSPPEAPPDLMTDEDALPHALEGLLLSAREDARRLVRIFQCTQCSRPYTAPATLPCGHTFCWKCLPTPEKRQNISYPEASEHQLGFFCPICGEDTFEEQCRRDVALAKVLDVIREAMEHHRAKYDSSPALLEEIPLYKSEEASKTSGVSMVHHAVLHGGRLASIFEMAEKGMLSIASEVTYHSRSPTGDEYEGLDLELLSRLREAVLKEMDCLVCYHTMIHPTTASCGHTFCRRCLLSVMDCTIICPACRQRFNMDRRLLEQRENRCLSELVQSLCPDEISSREQALKEEEQPGAGELDTPLFVCTISYPAMPTLLHIFESRYRLMMRRCIAGNRRFGMLSNNDRAEPQGNLGATPFKEYGCMLEIVNFHLFPDGRSMVETKGLARFRVVDHDMLDGYHVGRVERVDDVSLDQEKRLEASEIENALAYAAAHNSKHSSTALCPANFPDLMSTADLFRYCRQYVATLQARNERDERNRDLNRRVLNWMGPIPTDPAIFPYWFASVLPIEKEEQYQLLRTTTVRERLKIVYIWIRSLEQLPWYRSSCHIL